MTYKDNAIAEMLHSDSSGRLQTLYDRLLALNLKTKISGNTDTLLFQARGSQGKLIGLAAFRPCIYPVFSFPAPYWRPHSADVDKALSSIPPRHFIETEGPVSGGQYSLRQIRVSEDTIDALLAVVDGLIAKHANT